MSKFKNPFKRKKGGGGSPKTIIFAYFYGLAYGICTKVDELIAFRMNGETKATPRIRGCGSFSAQTGIQGSISSGYSSSTINFYDGSQTSPDGLLQKYTGYPLAYKNTAYFCFHGFVGDNVSSVPNYSCVVRRTNLGFSDYDDINGDVNPASAIYFILTKMTKLDESFLNKGSFLECARILKDEGLGVSFVMSKSSQSSEWIKELLRTIDGAICIDSMSGKLLLRLFRGDYDKTNLRQISEANSNEVKFTRKAWDSVYSRCTINYTDSRNFDKNSISANNSATRATIGYERNYEVDFMAISNATNANKVLSRLMKKMTYPFASVKFNVSSAEFKDLKVGDVLSFSNEKLNVKNMAIRILSLGADKQSDQKIEIEAVEDVFALQGFAQNAPQENLAVPDDLSMGKFKYAGAIECTAEMSIEPAILPMAIWPSGFVEIVAAKDGLNGSAVDLPKFALARLKNDLAITPQIGDELYFEVEEITPLYEIEASRQEWQKLQFICVIDGEFIAFGLRKSVGERVWSIKTLIRGIIGTKIKAHSAGALVWFAGVSIYDLDILELNSPNSTIYFVAKSFAAEQTTSLEFTHSLGSTKPYAPCDILAKRQGEIVFLSWRYREAQSGANYRNADDMKAGEDELVANNDIVIQAGEISLKTKEQSINFELKEREKIKIYALAPDGAKSDEIILEV